MPRFYCPIPLAPGDTLELPAGAARHVQVLRMQPGHTLTLFNGDGGECEATVLRMGRSDVQVCVERHTPIEREAGRAIHLIAGLTANERMDWLVEKATELGVDSITPLLAERSVLRIKGERAEKKREHWQAIAIAACEQSGRNRVPVIHPVCTLSDWLSSHPVEEAATPASQRVVLSLSDGTQPLASIVQNTAPDRPVYFLSGPEGGLSATEDALARQHQFAPVTLGSRILRAETAPLAALARLVL